MKNTKRLLALLLTLTILTATALSAAAAGCPLAVDYNLGSGGVSADLTSESVAQDTKPAHVPKVTALDRRTFLGWSKTDPSKLKVGEVAKLVDPASERIKEDTTFYAVYAPYHQHYVIGYPNGQFGPSDFITRGSVATIIARAGLEDFVEGYNYGNPGNYSDVSGHWAESAIAYCSKFGVFNGYLDGTFRPDAPITRQEYVTAVARLAQKMGRVPADLSGQKDFEDMEDVGAWAVEGLKIATGAGWIDGYTDGTFKPLNNIRRDEAVKVFNAYLYRGVDADGLADLHEYVHSGVASNNTEDGTDEYMTWPDVPSSHWAYYEIIEAANDHALSYTGENKQTLPEKWNQCWIDERWRYHDDVNDGGPLAGTDQIVQDGE